MSLKLLYTVYSQSLVIIKVVKK